MTPKSSHICRCDICIIPKDKQIDLNRYRTKLITYLQQKSGGRHTRNSLFSTTGAEPYKDKVFPVGECLHATIKGDNQCITCIPI